MIHAHVSHYFFFFFNFPDEFIEFNILLSEVFNVYAVSLLVPKMWGGVKGQSFKLFHSNSKWGWRLIKLKKITLFQNNSKISKWKLINKISHNETKPTPPPKKNQQKNQVDRKYKQKLFMNNQPSDSAYYNTCRCRVSLYNVMSIHSNVMSYFLHFMSLY